MAQTAKIPKVAIIMRTKDRPLFLRRALDSVASQTYADYILIIVNDGGNKNVLEGVIKEYEGNIKGSHAIIHNKVSMGMQPAANKGIVYQDSTYVTIHDDDDVWAPAFLEETVKYLEKSKSTKGLVVKTNLVYEEVRDNKIVTTHTEEYHPGLESISLFKLCFENYATPICFIYRREVYATLGYYDEDLGGVADWDFAIRFMSQFDIDFLNTSEPLAYYHHRPSADGVDANSVSTLVHRQLINKMMNKYLREDIKQGRLGLGYLINKLPWDDTIEKRIQYSLGEYGKDTRRGINTLLEKTDSGFSEQRQLILGSYRRFFDFIIHLPGILFRKIFKNESASK